MPKHSPEQVENVANSIMPNFIPKDGTLSNLSFSFTLDGTNYKVAYLKDAKGIWKLVSQERAE